MGDSSLPNPSEQKGMMEVLTALLKSQASQQGFQMTNENMAQVLITNMQKLVRDGKLTQAQIVQLKEFADKHKYTPAASGSTPATTSTPGTPQPTQAAPTPAFQNPAFKTGPDTNAHASLTTAPIDAAYPISQTLTPVAQGPVQWPATRPTLSGGIPSGRMTGTPAQIAKPEDTPGMLTFDDNRASSSSSRRKSTPGDVSMRRTIQDLVSSVDPNVKIEPEVEDLLLNIADEFIDSVTNFSCRLAKHRGADTLDVRDLQLHLERNHNIRIPGFASDDTRISLSQSSVTPIAAASSKKNAQGAHMTLRSQRLNQVQQAKRESKLL